jgi:hypothetical protein
MKQPSEIDWDRIDKVKFFTTGFGAFTVILIDFCSLYPHIRTCAHRVAITCDYVQSVLTVLYPLNVIKTHQQTAPASQVNLALFHHHAHYLSSWRHVIHAQSSLPWHGNLDLMLSLWQSTAVHLPHNTWDMEFQRHIWLLQRLCNCCFRNRPLQNGRYAILPARMSPSLLTPHLILPGLPDIPWVHEDHTQQRRPQIRDLWDHTGRYTFTQKLLSLYCRSLLSLKPLQQLNLHNLIYWTQATFACAKLSLLYWPDSQMLLHGLQMTKACLGWARHCA